MGKNNTYQNWTDDAIISAYQKSGEKDLVGELFNRYHAMVYGVCLKYLQDSSQAKDMVMVVFENLFEKLKHHTVDNFKPWLYVMTKNQCFMHLRKKKIQTSDIAETEYKLEDYHEEELALKKEHEIVLQQIEQGISTLKEDQKNCIQLFFIEQKSYNEIEAITGLTYKKIKSAIQNGKRNLRIFMES